jgi:hypothetical protein
MSNKKAKITRGTDGLIKGIDYVFNEDGLIDWRKMIKTEHLVPNKDRTSETDVSKLKDSQLIILLGGIKDLAQIRGYTDVRYDVVSPSPNYVVATCSISWKPNYETEGQEVTFSSIGDASHENTKSFAKLYLGPIAENRAFVRCVRNFLKINIVSAEELGDTKFVPETSTENKSDPYNILDSVMKEKGVTFSHIKTKLIKEGYENAEGLESVSELPKFKIFELVERLKKVKKKA